MHLISAHCGRALRPWFITATKPYDHINILSTSGNDKSVQQEPHLSSQTWCDEVFQLVIREHHMSVLHSKKGEANQWWLSLLSFRLLTDKWKGFKSQKFTYTNIRSCFCLVSGSLWHGTLAKLRLQSKENSKQDILNKHDFSEAMSILLTEFTE